MRLARKFLVLLNLSKDVLKDQKVSYPCFENEEMEEEKHAVCPLHLAALF